MKSLKLWAALMVTALLFEGCGGRTTPPDPARMAQEIADSKATEIDLVHATIGEPERADRFIKLLATRDHILDRVSTDVLAHKARVQSLNDDYGSQRSDFDVLLAEYNQKRSEAQSELLDLISEMKRTTTADEWDKISKFQLDRLDPRELAYRGLAGGL